MRSVLRLFGPVSVLLKMLPGKSEELDDVALLYQLLWRELARRPKQYTRSWPPGTSEVDSALGMRSGGLRPQCPSNRAPASGSWMPHEDRLASAERLYVCQTLTESGCIEQSSTSLITKRPLTPLMSLQRLNDTLVTR